MRWKSLSRPCLSVFNLFLCRDLSISVTTSKLLFSLKYVATLNSFVAIRSVHYVSFTCRDFVSLSGPETLSFSVATFITLSRHKLCLLFFLVSQHKLICRSILPILFFNFLSRHKISCRDRISAFFLFLLSQQELSCRDRLLLVLTSSRKNLVATLFLFVFFYID